MRVRREVLGLLLIASAVGAAPEALSLDPPPVQLGGTTLVPALVFGRWLGAEVQLTDDGRGLDGRLGGRMGSFQLAAGVPTARVVGRTVALTHPPLLVDHELYVPLRFLAETYGYKLDWDPATRTTTVTKGDHSAQLTVPRPVYPVVDASTGVLLGGRLDDAWADSKTMAAVLTGKESYRLFDLARAIATVAGGKPSLEAPGEFQHVALTPPAPDDTLTVATTVPWNPLPHPVTSQDLTQPVYLDAVRDILRAHGLPRAKPVLTQVLRVDLNGDGEDEVLLTGMTDRAGYPTPSISPNDYAFVALRQVVGGKVRTTLLDGEFHPTGREFAAPWAYHVAALLDLDGDGVQEIVVSSKYYEGVSMTVYQLQGGKPVQVLADGMGA